MNLEFNLINILILFGAVQGFILCFFIYQKHKRNKLSTFFFVLFLFSLAFLNIMYVCIDIDLFKYYRPLHLFPFPYKWLLGIGFYFYIKNQFKNGDKKAYHIKEWYLFIPAILYGILKTYWFFISVSENSYRITGVLVDSNFFRVNEICFLLFTVFLLIKALQFIKDQKTTLALQGKLLEHLEWLKKFTTLFLLIMLFEIILFVIDLSIHNGKESFLFMYPFLIINVAFIYWIGYIGFIKPNLIINAFKLKIDNIESEKEKLIKQKLKHVIEVDEIYKNPNLTISEFAIKLDISTKELSNYINQFHGKNFSEFLSYHRIEKVKKLLNTQDISKFTLLKFAEDAGFSSKSSFNATFKKMVGITPSAYKKQLQ